MDPLILTVETILRSISSRAGAWKPCRFRNIVSLRLSWVSSHCKMIHQNSLYWSMRAHTLVRRCSRLLLDDLISAAMLRGPYCNVSWTPRLLAVSLSDADLDGATGTMRMDGCCCGTNQLLLNGVKAGAIPTMIMEE